MGHWEGSNEVQCDIFFLYIYQKCYFKNIIFNSIIKESKLNYTVKYNNLFGSASVLECVMLLSPSESPDPLSHFW